ncbi:sporulation protein YlmC with PRC-barrel domain [Phyllobacterium ifriqiyense]|uniref:Sporulation protein YlmC with PRC-barrel domain n=1 Tax=Phyllobacterium ifriqiyense TaxID=314238 RepID=A0ABU0S942_9HYPH|nr:PRC-barrel domain-containing protein [Phyllobacterium ifriqiyense]MDQ0997272.1 sporulation protein YlmC with PRC-barrel domain [Phyllobacterium ifriqiyense]
MLKRLISSSAIVVALTITVAAQDGSDIFGQPIVAAPAQDRYLVAAPGQVLTAGLIGQTVYNSSNDDAASIGEIKDVVLNPEGRTESAVIAVGGFLGVGQKEVAVSLDQLSWAEKPDNKRWLVIAASKEELEKAPAYDRSVLLTDGASDPAKAPEPAINATEQDIKKSPAKLRSALKAVPSSAMSADKLIGSAVYGPEDETLGSVGDALMTPDGQIEAFVVDVGGFLGLGKKPIAVSIENLDLLADDSGKISVFTPFTKKELEAQPAYTPEAYKADSEKILLRGTAE